MEHENLPPPGYVQVGSVPTHGDPPLPSHLTPAGLHWRTHPALARALNLVREDNGGASWPAQGVTVIPDYWLPWLDRMEAAVAGLSDSKPAPEDAEAVEAARTRAVAYCDTELYSFVAGEHEVMRAMSLRSPELTAASAFLNDFFEGWSLLEELTRNREFRPDMPRPEDLTDE